LLANPEWAKKPIVFVETPDREGGSHLLVNGTHRYVLFYALKAEWIPAYIVPWDVGKEFIIADMPQVDEAKLMQWSGLSVLRRITDQTSRRGSDR
jgi:hypothetical protein